VIICVTYAVLEVLVCVMYNCHHYFLIDMHFLLHVSLQNPVNEVIDINGTDLITNYLRLPPYRDSLCTLK